MNNQSDMKQPVESPTEEKKNEVNQTDEGAGAKGSKEKPKGDQEGEKWPGGGEKGENEQTAK